MTTRIIKITECHQCHHQLVYCEHVGAYLCTRSHLRRCPPTGTPAWCPLEAIEDAGGAR